MPPLKTVVVKRCQPMTLAAGTEAGLRRDPGVRRRTAIRVRLFKRGTKAIVLDVTEN